MNRIKNGIILLILISFLCFVAVMPVNCVLKTVTGISCPACGMTRSFFSILHLQFFDAIHHNLFGIPFFVFIMLSIIIIFRDFIFNSFEYIPKLLCFFEKHYTLIFILLTISILYNNTLAG